MEEQQIQWKSLQDYPISEEEKDELGFSKYVKALTSFVTECETPMTIAIQGEWGSGKSSIMELMKEQLLSKDITKQESSKIEIVQINTWEYAQLGNDKNLPLAFLGGIIDQILHKPQDNVMLNNLKKAALLVGKYAAIGIDSVVGNRAGDSFDRMVESIFGKKVQLPTVCELKKQFTDVVSENGKRVVFFIDDLDRLQPSKAVELMEVLKNFLDCKNCVFVLAVDYDVIKAGVREKYPELDEKKAEKFFNKIIQVPFIVPCEGKKDYIRELCKKSMIFKGIDLNSEEEDFLYEFIGKVTWNNPREIKRLTNLLAIQKLVNDSGNDNGTDLDEKQRIIQLTALLGIQLYSQNLYKNVIDNSLCKLEQIEVESDEIIVWKDFLNLIKGAKEENWEEMVNLSKITNCQVTQKREHDIFYAKIVNEGQEEAEPWRFSFGLHSTNGHKGLLCAIFCAAIKKGMRQEEVLAQMEHYCKREETNRTNKCAIEIQGRFYEYKYLNVSMCDQYAKILIDKLQIGDYFSTLPHAETTPIPIMNYWGKQNLTTKRSLYTNGKNEVDNKEVEKVFHEIKDAYSILREQERDKIIDYLASRKEGNQPLFTNKSGEGPISHAGGSGKGTYGSGRFGRVYDLSNWKYIETRFRSQYYVFISLQCFDIDPRSKNVHTLYDRIGIYVGKEEPPKITADNEQISSMLVRMKQTDLELPLSEKDLEALVKQIEFLAEEQE